MTFAEFKKKFQEHFELMAKDADRLYEVEVDKDILWNLCLDSFPAEANKIYRKRREFDCSCCRHFIKQFGNVVTIVNGRVTSIWDFHTDDDVFQPVLDALSEYIHRKHVIAVHYAANRNVGIDHSMEYGDPIIQWDHFSLVLPEKFVNRDRTSEGEFKGRERDIRNVFKRSLDQISLDAVDTVLELISSNTLYRGAEWKEPLSLFRKYKTSYLELTNETAKSLYAWEQAAKAGVAVGKIRNHSIGVLLVDISEGMDLEQAVRRYEQIVAPMNYKRPKAVYTQKMLEDAKKKILELGYMESLPRRHATLNDISVNNILFCNRDVAKDIRGGDIFDDMMAGATRKPMVLERVEEIGFENFINNVLPTAKELEVYFENRHAKNMVSLIAPQNAEAPSMFKWNNNFGWAYAGNVTDSLKENVKAAGGKVDGVLRFSIQWNDGPDHNPNDFDAHCEIKRDRFYGNRGHIFFANKYDIYTQGQLDVDIRYPMQDKVAVENITWPKLDAMHPGEYQFYVHNYCHNGGRSGFKAEIEFDGQIYSFEYPNELHQGDIVKVATVTLDSNKCFSIKPHLSTSQSSKEVWNLHTNNFIPVSVMMYSPNYWDEQEGIGHRHCFFMLKNCLNPDNPNGFYNEFLKNELMEHKRVFEALGNKMIVGYSDDQLSGIGFSTTKRDDVVVRVTGATKRLMKVKF